MPRDARNWSTQQEVWNKGKQRGDDRRVACTVGEHVRERRIEQARRLLVESDAPLFEIAARVGFADHSHFTRTFRRRFGIPPGEYRRLARLR